METRQFGRTGHMSSVAIFGGAAFWEISQEEADRSMELVIQHGVNHIDVAPSYGQAEERLGPWLKRERDRFFVGCKTQQREKGAAEQEMHASLKRLNIERFDLYQIHAITTMEELDLVTRKGGVLETLVQARQDGLTRHLGITGHGVQAPAVFLEALRRFEFDSVLFPLNFVQCAEAIFRHDVEALLTRCRQLDVGTMVIKSITRGPWGDQSQDYTTWYQPFDSMAQIQPAVNFVLSHDVTGLCTVGDTRLLPLVLQACQEYQPMDAVQQAEMISRGSAYTPLFS
jgi:aryl-alcohol dehydrogenase-like predicted oxidoreductase